MFAVNDTVPFHCVWPWRRYALYRAGHLQCDQH